MRLSVLASLHHPKAVGSRCVELGRAPIESSPEREACPKSRRGHVSKAREPRGRTSRRLCGSLAFEARIRRARSTVASRLVRRPDEGMDALRNKGRPGSTPDALGARAARERDDGDPPNVAQAYRPIGAEDRFQSCFRLRRGKPLDRTVVPAKWNRIGKVGSARAR